MTDLLKKYIGYVLILGVVVSSIGTIYTSFQENDLDFLGMILFYGLAFIVIGVTLYINFLLKINSVT